MTPWDKGAARARAGRDLPDAKLLRRDWELSELEAGLFGLGYLEAKSGGFPAGTRAVIERAFRAGLIQASEQ
jgi:hypothetical protein